MLLKDPTVEQIVAADAELLKPYRRKTRWGLELLSEPDIEHLLENVKPRSTWWFRRGYSAEVANVYGKSNSYPQQVCRYIYFMRTRQHLYVSIVVHEHEVRGRGGIAVHHVQEDLSEAKRGIHRWLVRGGFLAKLRVSSARSWYWDHWSQIDQRQRRELKRWLMPLEQLGCRRKSEFHIHGDECFIVTDGVMNVQMKRDERGVLLRIQRGNDDWRNFVVVRDASNRHRMHALAVPPDVRTPTAALAWTANMSIAEYSQLRRES